MMMWMGKEIGWETSLGIKNYLEKSMKKKVDAIKKGYVHSDGSLTREESISACCRRKGNGKTVNTEEG